MKKNFVSSFNKMKILKNDFNLNKKEYIINVLCNTKLMEKINEVDILYENNNKIPLKAFQLYKSNNKEKKTHKINFTEILNHQNLFDKLSKEDKKEFNKIKKLKIRNLFNLRNNSNLSFINKYKKYLDSNNKTKLINNTTKLNSNSNNDNNNKMKILLNTNNYITNSKSNKSIKISTSSTTIKSMSISPYNSKNKSINLQKTYVKNNNFSPSNSNIFKTSNNSKEKNLKILYKNKNYNNNFNKKYYSTQISNNVSVSNINDNALKINEFDMKFNKVIKKRDVKNIIKKIKLLDLKDDVKYYENSFNSEPNLEKNSSKNINNFIRPSFKSCEVVNFNKTNYKVKNNLKIYLSNSMVNRNKSFKNRFKSFDKIFLESNRIKEKIKGKIYDDIKNYKDKNFHQIYYKNYLEKNKDRKDWLKDNFKFLRDEVLRYSKINGPFIYNENGSGNYEESHKKIRKGELTYKQSVAKSKRNFYIDIQKTVETMQKNKNNDIINEKYLKNKKNL